MENRVIRLSIIEDDIAVVVASWASPIKYQVYRYTVRGREVDILPNFKRAEHGNDYRLCLFDRGARRMWVNVNNLRGVKLNKFAGGTE